MGNTAETWSCCTSSSDGDMLRVWFSCSPFLSSQHGVKTSAGLEVCTKDKQLEMSRFFGVWRNERDGDPPIVACQVRTDLFAIVKLDKWIESFKSSRIIVVGAKI
jgi:hypothetical protein